MFRDQRRYGNDPSVVVRAAEGTFNSPLKWNEPKLVFTCSWSDWFHEDADAWRPEAWDIIRRTPHLTYQILTKRPERIAANLPHDWDEGYPNVWLGVSIENRRFVGRADILREIPAAVRFISAEPLLGPLLGPHRYSVAHDTYGMPFPLSVLEWPDGFDGPELDLDSIDWLIVGGESGPDARRMRSEWVRDLRDACRGEGVSFHFKQWGGPRPGGSRELDGVVWDEMPDYVPVPYVATGAMF